MTPEHNMIEETTNPLEEGGSAGTGTGDEDTLRSGPEGGEVGSSSPRPDVGGRTRGDEPQRSGDDDTDEERVREEDDARERAFSTKERVEDAFTDEANSEILKLFNERSADPQHPLTQEHLIVLLNRGSSYDQIKQVADEVKIPADELIAYLSAVGHDQATLDLVEAHRDSFVEKPRAESEQEQVVADEISKNIMEVKETMEQVKSGKMSAEEAEGKLDKLKKWLSTDPDGGLFREEDRYKRIIAKPLVSIMLAILISYILALSVITRGTTTRVGK